MKSPIFLIGNPRSGTTLLRLMLTCHRHIVIPPECGFMIWWYEKYGDWREDDVKKRLDNFIEDLFRSKKIETWNLDRELLKEFILSKSVQTYSSLVSSIYEFFAKDQKKDFMRWGDKNNFHLHHIITIHHLFPEARFIHIVRDGRDVACSYKELGKLKLGNKYAPKLATEVSEIAAEWTSNIETIRRSFDSIGWGRVMEIRYEDLVNSTEETLRNICSFLQDDYDPAMLNFYLLNKEKELEPKGFLEWKGMTTEKVTSSRVGKYKKDLTVEEIAQFKKAAGNIMKHYQYEVD